MAGIIPASGSVHFYLRMFNAKHGQTIPDNTIFNIQAVSASWEEGRGLDMDEYKDLDAVNWMAATSLSAAATATLVLAGDAGKSGMHNDTFTLFDARGGSQEFQFKQDSDVVTGGTIGLQSDTNTTDIITSIKTAINNVTDLAITAGTVVALAGANSQMTLTLTQDNTGLAGNTKTTESVTDLTLTDFTGGKGDWSLPGGDYRTGSYSAGSTLPMYTATLTNGYDDLEVEITSMVEEWIAGTAAANRQNYGIGIYLTSSQEAYYSSSLGVGKADANGVLDNLAGVQETYYTKKFFARGSEFFFKRPVLEARWDSAKKDDRGNFYFSSSLSPAADNLNSLYMYNYVRGQLQDIGGNSSTLPTVKIYDGTATAPVNNSLTLKHAATNADVTNGVTATRIEKGIYSASFAITGTSSNTTYLYDVWSVGSDQVHTGTVITPLDYGSSDYNPYAKCVSKITNLKPEYSTEETARFRLFVRNKDWDPTIYTKAYSSVENKIIENAYYKVFRIYDGLDIIDYGTGSTTQHTRLSHDVSGNYFDLDMSMLEEDYMYGIKFLYRVNDVYQEQSEVFKFRVIEEV
tara:strand:- start:392 stop:2116 length:1725 start_codon:yes stop_codon:yes gene_type:complete